MAHPFSPTAFMADVPRGKAWDYVKTQTPPQARWQDPAAILKAKALDYDPRNPQGKILIGALGDKLIGINDDRHIQTVAGNRSGKSVAVINNLLFYDGAVIAVDPKGELARTTAVARAKLGQRVVILDPFATVTGEAARFRGGYNPLTTLWPGNPTNIEDAILIAEGIVIPAPNAKDPHWDESAMHFLQGIILATALGVTTAKSDRHLGTVRQRILMALQTDPVDDASGDSDGDGAGDGQGGAYLLARDMMRDADAIARSGDEITAQAIEGAVASFYDKPENERAGVLSTLRRHTQFLDFRAMRDVLSRHDVDLADLKRDPKGVTVFLCLPAMRMKMCNRWLRTIVNQLLDAMEREAAKPEIPVLAVLDEFPVLGHMAQLENAAGQVASFGLKLWTILQDWGQGKAIYKDRFESFAANAGVSVFFANVDLTSSEYISKRLGKTLVTGLRKGDTAQTQRDQGMSGRSESPELHDMLTPDEVARVFARADPAKRQLVLWAGLSPMVIQRVAYFDRAGPLAGYVGAAQYGLGLGR